MTTAPSDSPPDSRRARRARPASSRRLRAVLAAGVALALVAAVGTVVTVQSRATAAREAQEADAARAAAEEAAERADARDEAAEAARRQAELDALVARWGAATADADAALAEGQGALDESAAQVEDDAVRTALSQAIDATRTARDAPAPTTPTGTGAEPPVLTALLAATGALREATLAVVQARTAWQAAQPAPGTPSAGPSPAPTVGGPPSVGAGPDCGGPGSYEPPPNDGRPSFYTSTPTAEGDGSNGRVPASAMAPLAWCQDSQGNKQWLTAAAADALTRMNEAFAARFGENIAVDLSYRSYDDQVEMRSYYGSAAARPGTSNHGWGTAFDTWEWAAYGFGSERYVWLVENGPAYGWIAPDWARERGSNPEYWHFEYVG